MTSLTTFEHVFRQRVLDILYAQWAALGAPFSDGPPPEGNEVIDPEALLWCSLEFLPTEPRLCEAVLEWLFVKKDHLVRPRVQRRHERHDPRAIIWQALDSPLVRAPDFQGHPRSKPLHGFDSPIEPVDFARRIWEQRVKGRDTPRRLGDPLPGPATLLLKARNLLGQDVRHFLLIYLLANPHGGKLRDIQEWSGYAYRTLADVVSRWESADVATLQTGYCRLNSPDPWRALLHQRSSKIILVKWLNVFDICVHLLRDLARAREKGLAEESAVHKTLINETAEKLASASSISGGEGRSIRNLLSVFPDPTSRSLHPRSA